MDTLKVCVAWIYVCQTSKAVKIKRTGEKNKNVNIFKYKLFIYLFFIQENAAVDKYFTYFRFFQMQWSSFLHNTGNDITCWQRVSDTPPENKERGEGMR